MERHHQFIAKFREVEYAEKIKKAACSRSNIMNNHFYKEGDEVFYQEKDRNAWLGPSKVFCQKGREVYIFANGHIKKIHTCKVKPFRCEVDHDDIKTVKIQDNQVPEIVSEDAGGVIAGVGSSQATECSDKKELQKDTIGTFWMSVSNNECFLEDVTTYVVELPSSKHNTPEVKEAKKVELQNLKDYDTFEEVADSGQDRISSRWVITVKEAHDGQKTKCKARLVARGFQENVPPQSDSPTVLRESNKLFSAVAANQGFGLLSVDIRAAFLQSKELQRDVFVVPPKDLAEVGILWKLKKPLYGLNDALRRFWLRVKKIFEEENMKTLPGDEAFYYKNIDGELIGMIITHVDDFQIAGTYSFIASILNRLESSLTISKVERDRYRFTGMDVSKLENCVELSMEDHAASIEEIKEIRKEKKEESLTNM